MKTSSWVEHYSRSKILIVLLALSMFFFIDDVLIVILIKQFDLLPRQFWIISGILLYLMLLSIGLAFAVLHQMRKRPVTGIEGIIGTHGKSITNIFNFGHAMVHGEIWNARSEQPIPANSDIVVINIERMTLVVRSGKQNLEK